MSGRDIGRITFSTTDDGGIEITPEIVAAVTDHEYVVHHIVNSFMEAVSQYMQGLGATPDDEPDINTAGIEIDD